MKEYYIIFTTCLLCTEKAQITDPEIKSLCEDFVEAQKREIAVKKDLLQESIDKLLKSDISA